MICGERQRQGAGSKPTRDVQIRVTYNHPELGKGKINLPSAGSCKIGEDLEIDLTGSVTIQEDVEISDHVRIFTHKHHWRDFRGPRRDGQQISVHNLVIERDAFIGTGAQLIGVNRIGAGAVIGAGVVIGHDVGPGQIWEVQPAVMTGVRGKKDQGAETK